MPRDSATAPRHFPANYAALPARPQLGPVLQSRWRARAGGPRRQLAVLAQPVGTTGAVILDRQPRAAVHASLRDQLQLPRRERQRQRRRRLRGLATCRQLPRRPARGGLQRLAVCLTWRAWRWAPGRHRSERIGRLLVCASTRKPCHRAHPPLIHSGSNRSPLQYKQFRLVHRCGFTAPFTRLITEWLTRRAPGYSPGPARGAPSTSAS